ncbi:DUF7882 family protein [Pseudoclavibacter helvolus]
MGFMYYGSQSHELEIDDRPLAHLKIALLSLLRAGHSVAFSTSRPAGQGSGRETLWISPATDLRFRFVDGRLPAINDQWVRAIIGSADSAAGMRICPEPAHANPLAAGRDGRTGRTGRTGRELPFAAALGRPSAGEALGSEL